MTDPLRQISVSDHAVLRYLERHCGVDVEAIRAQIARDCACGAALGAPVVRIDKARFVIRKGIVVTCYPPGERVHYDAMHAARDRCK